MLESLLVGAIVLVAACYAVWALLPATTRRQLALKGVHALGGPAAPGMPGTVARQLQKLAQGRAGGCSECPAATLTPAERRGKGSPSRDGT
jgi:predicted amidohydrolase